MTNIEAKQRALKLIEQNPLVMMLGTVGPDGAPEVKGMVKMRNDGLLRFWFCSNTSARRTEVLRHDNRACLYAYEFVTNSSPMICRGVMLSGIIDLSWDDDLRRSLWKDFMMLYYPSGPLDPDFVVLQFTAERGNYYEGLQNKDFLIAQQ